MHAHEQVTCASPTSCLTCTYGQPLVNWHRGVTVSLHRDAIHRTFCQSIERLNQEPPPSSLLLPSPPLLPPLPFPSPLLSHVPPIFPSLSPPPPQLLPLLLIIPGMLHGHDSSNKESLVPYFRHNDHRYGGSKTMEEPKILCRAQVIDVFQLYETERRVERG